MVTKKDDYEYRYLYENSTYYGNKGDKKGFKERLAEFNSERKELTKEGYSCSDMRKEEDGVIIYEFRRKKK